MDSPVSFWLKIPGQPQRYFTLFLYLPWVKIAMVYKETHLSNNLFYWAQRGSSWNQT